MTMRDLIQQRIDQLKTEIDKSVAVHNFLRGQLQEAMHWLEGIAQQELQRLTDDVQISATPASSEPVEPVAQAVA